MSNIFELFYSSFVSLLFVERTDCRLGGGVDIREKYDTNPHTRRIVGRAFGSYPTDKRQKKDTLLWIPWKIKRNGDNNENKKKKNTLRTAVFFDNIGKYTFIFQQIFVRIQLYENVYFLAETIDISDVTESVFVYFQKGNSRIGETRVEAELQPSFRFNNIVFVEYQMDSFNRFYLSTKTVMFNDWKMEILPIPSNIS